MYSNKEVHLCSISNIESGTCLEDCKFCTQSIKNDTNVQRYKKKAIEEIVQEAKIAKAHHASGFCLVSAGKELTDVKLEYILEIVHALKKENLGLNINACNGLASLDKLKALKHAGVALYNHNLEASQSFYPTLCTTHTWQERYQTCLHVKEAGLHLACGGIFGVGETCEDRLSLFESIETLQPTIVPLNFFFTTQKLSLPDNTLSRQEAFELIHLTREKIPSANIVMIGGGREAMFQEEQYDVFKYGANSFIIGNYLTTEGAKANNDLEMLREEGYTILHH